MVGRRADADSLGCAQVRVAKGLGDPLELVRWGVLRLGRLKLLRPLSEDLVQHHDIVRRPAGALDYRMQLQEEVPHPFLCNTTVDNRTQLTVTATVYIFGLA